MPHPLFAECSNDSIDGLGMEINAHPRKLGACLGEEYGHIWPEKYRILQTIPDRLLLACWLSGNRRAR